MSFCIVDFIEIGTMATFSMRSCEGIISSSHALTATARNSSQMLDKLSLLRLGQITIIPTLTPLADF